MSAFASCLTSIRQGANCSVSEDCTIASGYVTAPSLRQPPQVGDSNASSTSLSDCAAVSSASSRRSAHTTCTFSSSCTCAPYTTKQQAWVIAASPPCRQARGDEDTRRGRDEGFPAEA